MVKEHTTLAYHNSTPDSVLDAPAIRPRWFVRYRFPDRHDRRHARTANGGWRFVPKGRQAPSGMNEPYRKAVDTAEERTRG